MERLLLEPRKDYVMVKSIGKGAFGQVYTGYMVQTGEQIVVKEGYRKDLEGEYNILQTLRGVPHIVQIKGKCEVDSLDRPNRQPNPNDRLHIVMEKAQFGLDRLLMNVPFRRGLQAIDILQLCTDLGAALRLLVDRGLVHRDIKPPNILVFGSGAAEPKSRFSFKLCDFGYAREVQTENQELMTIAGTPGFLHPALVREYTEHPRKLQMNKPYAAMLCDLWSLGATIFNAASCRYAFPHKDEAQFTKRLYEGRPRGSICGRQNGMSFVYYTHIRNELYPRWLRRGLSDLISTQFDDPDYSKFYAQCEALATAQPKRLVHLPSFTPTTLAQLDPKLFPSASSPEATIHGVFGVDRMERMLVLSPTTVYRVSPDLCLSSLRGDTFIVWAEGSNGHSNTEDKCLPLEQATTHIDERIFAVQDIYDLRQQCDDAIEAWRAVHNIVHTLANFISRRVKDMQAWLISVDTHHNLSATVVMVAALVNDAGREMLRQLEPAEKESVILKGKLKEAEKEMTIIREMLSTWTPLYERPIANCEDSMERLKTPDRTTADGDAIYAITMKRMMETRLRDLREDARQIITRQGGARDVILRLVKCNDEVEGYKNKMVETVKLVENIRVPAQRAVKGLLESSAEEAEGIIRKQLTNTVRMAPVLKSNVESQKRVIAEIGEQLAEMAKSLGITVGGEDRRQNLTLIPDTTVGSSTVGSSMQLPVLRPNVSMQ